MSQEISSSPHPQQKFIDKILHKIELNEPFFSFEFFPPRTPEGLNNLYGRFKRMNELGPVCFFFIFNIKLIHPLFHLKSFLWILHGVQVDKEQIKIILH